MYPLTDKSLSVADIAKHWSRDLPQHPPWREIVETMLGAVWIGELDVNDGGDRVTPEYLLGDLARQQTMPGILIYHHADELPPLLELTQDGGALADARKRIQLPADPASRTADIITEACAILATCKLTDYGDVVAPILAALEVTRDIFGIFCDARGYNRPTFWFGTNSAKTKPKSFGGRPTVIREIEAEMRRRAGANELLPTRRANAVSVYEWAMKTISPKHQIAKPRAMENALRPIFDELGINRGKHKT